MSTMLAIASGSAQDAQTIAELKATLALMKDTNTTLIERIEKAQQRHRTDIATIGEALMDEAEKRDWCYEYDTVVADLNRNLHVELPVRKREFSVTVNVQVTITVDATDESDARSQAYDIARDAESTLDKVDGVYTSNWDDSYSYEVEES